MDGQMALLEERREIARDRRCCPEVIGNTPKLLAALRVARRAAEDGECTVLVTGETGTGKELIAHAIHYHGPRRERPFAAINSASLPTALAESLLFGHQRGAYTDAVAASPGIFQATSGGTVFLDEVQELALPVQAKLLRFMQDHQVTALGGESSHEADVRIVAGSNQDLEQAVARGSFRADLYFRLNVVPIRLPPLRERRPDIPLLVDHFLAELNSKKGGHVTIGLQAMAALEGYDWPGNIRELRNIIERLVILGPSRWVHYQDLPATLLQGRDDDFRYPAVGETNLKRAKQQVLAAFERDFIRRHWAAHDWHIGNTAVAIGESREWLGKQIRRYGLERGAAAPPTDP